MSINVVLPAVCTIVVGLAATTLPLLLLRLEAAQQKTQAAIPPTHKTNAPTDIPTMALTLKRCFNDLIKIIVWALRMHTFLSLH